MTLFSWYLTSKQEIKQEKTLNNSTEKSSHIEGMWPIAKVRQNTQVQHQEYISNKQADVNFLTTKKENSMR